ncbi:MAG: hypothetical protein ABI821_12750 [Pseudomonadota bacterium]
MPRRIVDAGVARVAVSDVGSIAWVIVAINTCQPGPTVSSSALSVQHYAFRFETPPAFPPRSSNTMRRLRILTISLASVCVATACARDPYADHVSSEDEKVMETMVEIACKVDGGRIVVSDQPAVPRQNDPHAADRHNVQFGIDFDRRRARAARWPRGQICPAVRVAASSKIASALTDEADPSHSWDTFSERFGGARSLMRISLPVYSLDGKRAVIYTVGRCPYRCGEGFYHELEKTYGKWKITRSEIAWTS